MAADAGLLPPAREVVASEPIAPPRQPQTPAGVDRSSPLGGRGEQFPYVHVERAGQTADVVDGQVITVLAAVSDAVAFFRHCIPHLVIVDIAGAAGTADAVLRAIRSAGPAAGEAVAGHGIDSSVCLEPISALASGLRSCLAKP